MSPSIESLQAAFRRTGLPAQGYSFQSAMQCEALQICLRRLSLIAEGKAKHSSTPPFWWLKD